VVFIEKVVEINHSWQLRKKRLGPSWCTIIGVFRATNLTKRVMKQIDVS
jgi:hypothetical protein